MREGEGFLLVLTSKVVAITARVNKRRDLTTEIA